MLSENRVFKATFNKIGSSEYLLLMTLFSLIHITNVFADNADNANEYDLKYKAREFCEQNPLDAKCRKYLDSEYRLHKDSEKETKDQKLERYSEQRYRKEKLTELISFCRDVPDSIRCKELKK